MIPNLAAPFQPFLADLNRRLVRGGPALAAVCGRIVRLQKAMRNIQMMRWFALYSESATGTVHRRIFTAVVEDAKRLQEVIKECYNKYQYEVLEKIVKNIDVAEEKAIRKMQRKTGRFASFKGSKSPNRADETPVDTT